MWERITSLGAKGLESLIVRFWPVIQAALLSAAKSAWENGGPAAKQMIVQALVRLVRRFLLAVKAQTLPAEYKWIDDALDGEVDKLLAMLPPDDSAPAALPATIEPSAEAAAVASS